MTLSNIAIPSLDEAAAHAAATAEEQAMLDQAFSRRDGLLAQLESALASPVRDAVEQARMRMLGRRRAELEHAGQGLIFGRLDSLDDTVRHLGRVGIPSPDEDSDPLVIDWRAPAARAFYTATPVDPQGQARRRHIRTSGREVVGLDDEPLDGSRASSLVGEGALLAALGERRTGRMGVAAATLQREQDDVVRADARGPLVVQGGPGTGKTVVALHRVAYLLFTHQQLAHQGVLVIGPSPRFLDYIAQVLPALGESAMVSATCDTLVPGIEVERVEARDVAEIKGRALWQDVLTRYAASFLPQPAGLGLVWEGELHALDERRIARIVAAAGSGRSHHGARAACIEHIHGQLADAVAERGEELLSQVEDGLEDLLSGVDADLRKQDTRGVAGGAGGSDVDGVLADDELERLRERIADDTSVAAALEAWWPTLDPTVELRRLLGDETLLRQWAPELNDAEQAWVAAEPAAWASSDIPLFDALAALLGDGEVQGKQGGFLAGRAAGQRDWVYGHVVIDEAQELSEMQWQMIMRRCPSRSITAVGDIDQAEAPHRHTTWGEAVGAAFGGRWSKAQLTICYRTPGEVMALTGPVLRQAGSHNKPPVAVRSSGIEPWERTVNEQGLVAVAVRAVADLSERWHGGMVGVVAPVDRLAALRAALPGVTVLSATETKGLEWDATLLVDAAGIAAEPRGWNGLYVALTRCTQELGQLLVA
ncbi:Putative superfamily I DNA and RNA helicase-like protein [Arthrobacter sp. PAMC 25486]|uniref:HelD family protein n=1 Tax=Arthrobacter sp. PAMC 25486 TaxID=1494608 RepID=UPI000535A5AC|nr:UvrD-helicase domain-containing protein [Arthrobacter sp. PAMC 25486]AIY00428.1 Putative superfamily I DNA and RNA helicase-like protein [Arthrobacter sp. PAMC 25486]